MNPFSENQSLPSKYIRGALAGLIATAPMTIAMEMLFRKLPRKEKSPLPPRVLTMKVADSVGVKPLLSQQDRFSLTLLSHFGYGAVCGLLYSASISRLKLPRQMKNRTSGLAEGATFGLGVWSASYMGWIPAIKMMEPAHQQPLRRSSLMIGVHLIWGAATGFLFNKITPKTITAFRG